MATEKKAKKVNLAEVAKSCGLSITAISSILNRNENYKVPEETRKLVFDTAKRLNYRPNLTARSLITRKHYTVGLLFFSIKDRCYSEMMAQIQHELAKRQYASLFAFWESSSLQDCVNFLLNHGIDGIITIAHEEELATLCKDFEIDVPVVYYSTSRGTGDAVIVERVAAMRKLLDLFHDNGYRRFGYLGNAAQEPRYPGLLAFLEERHLEINPDFLVTTANTIHDRELGMARMLSAGSYPELVICQNDVTAMVAMSMARKHGLRVPEDISFVGFDNIYESRCTVPALTTMDIQLDETAFELVDLLFQRFANPDAGQLIRSIEPFYVLRESTKSCSCAK